MKISNLMKLNLSSMRMPTLKIEKFIYMADGFYVYKMEDGYAVKDQFGYTLKTAKTVKTCENYVQLQLQTRRAAERYAIEEINKSKV
jgi:hypothetical protein